MGGDQRPHVELAIHWSPVNVQWDLVLECALLYGNPEKFLGPEASIDGYGEHSVKVKAVQLSLGIGHLPPYEYTVYVSPIPEYILGIDVLQGLWIQGLWLQTAAGELCLSVQVVKAILQGHTGHLPPPQFSCRLHNR